MYVYVVVCENDSWGLNFACINVDDYERWMMQKEFNPQLEIHIIIHHTTTLNCVDEKNNTYQHRVELRTELKTQHRLRRTLASRLCKKLNVRGYFFPWIFSRWIFAWLRFRAILRASKFQFLAAVAQAVAPKWFFIN